jgi:hypothetical protein
MQLARGKTMANESKKTKSETAPKKDATAKVESTAAEAAPKDAPKSDGGESAGTAPANYSRGEGQKPVSAAYKENWNAIFAKKSPKRKKR